MMGSNPLYHKRGEKMLHFKRYYEFVYRADTISKTFIAEEYINKIKGKFPLDIFLDLIAILQRVRKNLQKLEFEKIENILIGATII